VEEAVEFQLGGQNYNLNKEDVEDRLKHVAPADIRKHYVLVEGRRYPVKQALGAAIDRPVTDFISTDAIRILSNLGFEVGSIKAPGPEIKTVSEMLFEEYLHSKGLGYFQFHKQMPRTLKKPDYCLSFKGQELVFEVKELIGTDDEFKPRAGWYDPYEPIREKINSASKQFRGLGQYACCLVLFDKGKPGLDLHWRSIYAAMLGTPADYVPLNPVTGELDFESAHPVLNPTRAKMVRSKDGQPIAPQNTTISAIAVLEQMEIGRRRFNIEFERLRLERAHRSMFEEWQEELQLIQRFRGTERDVSLRQLRVVLCENPFRRISTFPREIFSGPYDEVYGQDETGEERITRVFAGEKIKELESQEAPAKSVMQRIAEDSRRKRQPATRHEPAGQV
jgi:hypothetical protein